MFPPYRPSGAPQIPHLRPSWTPCSIPYGQTGIRYLQSSSTTLQVVFHGEAKCVPPPLAKERLSVDAPRPGLRGLEAVSGGRTRTRDTETRPRDTETRPRPWQEVRNPALPESDVASATAPEAESCAQRLTGRLSRGAKWDLA